MPASCNGWVDKLEGHEVVFTGRVFVRDDWWLRTRCGRTAKALGAKVSDSFRKTTSVLVWGDLTSQIVKDPRRGLSRKLIAASDAALDGTHVHIISADGFADLIRGDAARCRRLTRRRGRYVASDQATSIYGGPISIPRVSRHAAQYKLQLDLNALDQGTNLHRKTILALRDYLAKNHRVALRPAASAPNYDAGWTDGRTRWIAEVKSVSMASEEQQLRLGLGQLLAYQGRLAANGHRVRAALIASSKPSNPTWPDICSRSGVTLSWPPSFPGLR